MSLYGKCQEALSNFWCQSTSAVMQPLNYILILTQNFICTCQINSSNLNSPAWKNYVNKFLETEKLIAIKNNTYDKLKTHWEKWLEIFEA